MFISELILLSVLHIVFEFANGRSEFAIESTDLNSALVYDRALVGYSLKRIPNLTLSECLQQCWSRGRCKSTNYRQQFQFCELNHKTKSEASEEDFISLKGSIYTDISYWLQNIKDICIPNPCNINQNCVAIENKPVCLVSDCDVPLNAECAKADVSQGISVHSRVTYSCLDGYRYQGQLYITCQADGTWSKQRFSCVRTGPFDCSEIKDRGINTSGRYLIYPDCYPKEVYCNMEKYDGGWTVITQRSDETLDFHRSWTEYRNGFGDPIGDHWIGNYYINLLTHGRSMDVLFVLTTRSDNTTHWYRYTDFKVADEANQYRLTFKFIDRFTSVEAYKQLCSTTIQQVCHNNTVFVTYDHGSSECPSTYGGGWWFNNCHHVLLTGYYYGYLGYRWIFLSTEEGREGYLKSSTMMIRPSSN